MAKAEEKKTKETSSELEQRQSATATAKYVRISPRKVRLVADMVRGKSISEAKAVLSFTPKGGAEAVGKVISSAVANAENNFDLSGDELFIGQIYVNEGPTLKRFRPRAMGRAARIRKRTSHITVKVATRKEV